MDPVNAELAGKSRRVILLQLLVTTVVAALFLGWGLFRGGEAGQEADASAAWNALSAVYGGLSSVVLALISIRGFKHANQYALSEPKKSMMILYIGAVIRFVAVLVLLGIGLGLIKLAPIAVFVGFALAQASYLMGARSGNKPRTA